ncbi:MULTISPECIES: PAS domain-containing protein [unclassified Sphingomonas]|uniref:hybrid sensor histidine kinase/response regulator n=1 Tax=unclassified Sphingomonas TaxID=196159 RepID=UPI0009E9AD6F|nr:MULTISPECIES: PAS domain-containing protein [unclassified Sphingomonas]
MTGRLTSNVSLTPELKQFIVERMATGDYANTSEVVRAGLCALRDATGAAARPLTPGWPAAGGECGALIRRRDWSQSPLGTPDGWSHEMRATIANIVNSPVAKVLMWGSDHILFYNDAYRAIIGDRHPLALGTPVAEALPEVWDWNRPILAAGLRGEVQSFHDQPIVLERGDGPETLFLDLYYTPVHDANGVAGGVLCTIVDHSERVAIEARLAASEAELRGIADAMPMLVAYVGADHRYRFANARYQEWFGTSPEAIVGRHIRDVIGEAAYVDRRADIDAALGGRAIVAETTLHHREAGPRRAEIRYVPATGADGVTSGVYILGIDITDRAGREAEVRASDRRFRTAMEAVHGVLWTNSADGRMLGEQPGWGALTGQSFDEYQGFGWSAAVHPDDAAATVVAWNAAVASRGMFVHEHRVRRHDGEWRTCAIRGLPILDDDGRIVEWVGVHTDISHQRAAEAALRDQAESLARQVRHRERAEEQLRSLNETLETRVIAEIAERRQAEAKLAQSQKMETVGKLTGGVAHDFNNLLQVIGGNLQLLGRDVAGNERAERRVANAMAGVSRGAKLASQLLAFGRRQALEPKVVNVTRFVQGMDDMLRRAIGEGVEIETVFAGGLWNTFIDPGQIENALLNLAINARDAMEGQGRLTIELSNAHLDDAYARTHEEVVPGQYVMLAVTDTGSGMSPDIVAKVFEPFFSTKAEGKGSGLGLSMVYGFVKQSGGHVKIYSEIGHGTTIKLYLPRAMESEDVEVAVDTGPVRGGTETVLVVEDDEEVRATVVALLGDLGYRVLKAADATSGLAVIESGVPIDLLFTDVVMPGPLKSPEMARKARERLPNIAVLFTSGYTENSIVHGGRLDKGVELLSKPYTREALARKFRHVLANQQQRGVATRTAPEPNPPVAVTTPPSLRQTALLVEDDDLIRTNTADMLKDAGFVVLEAASAEEALMALQTAPVDVLITDVNLPGASGRELATRARSVRPDALVVFATGDPGAVQREPNAVVLAKPYDAKALIAAVRGGVRRTKDQPVR